MTMMPMRIVEDQQSRPHAEQLDLHAPGSVTTSPGAISLDAWRAFRAYDRPDVYDIASAHGRLTDDDWAAEARHWADESASIAEGSWHAGAEAWGK